ncbi:MAG: hypothetical protein ACLVKO_11900 [Dysgonomonas sp.]
MKFTNLVVPISRCNVGEYLRLSKTEQIVQLVEKGLFCRVRLIQGGYSDIEPNRRVHRKID